MRSHALQLLRPFRATQCLRQPPHNLLQSRSATTTSRLARPAASSTTAAKRATASRPEPRVNNTGVKPPPTDPRERQIDPQAAIPPSGSVADVDPVSAATIPSAPSGLAAAISGSATGITGIGINGAAENGTETIDWSSSFHGLSTSPFSPETAAVLMKDINPRDVEIKPDGILYLPEIKYRRILNQAFGPGGWGLAPRGEMAVGEKVVTREFALIVHGRFVAIARGECTYFSEETIPTAGEGCKSNALTRCCKDLGIASELWDPRFIRDFKKQHCEEVWVEHVVSKKRRQIWKLKDADVTYPFQAVKR